MKLVIAKRPFDVGYVDLVTIITNLVHCRSDSCYEHISFDVKFKSDSVNNGHLIAGRIYITFLPVNTHV